MSEQSDPQVEEIEAMFVQGAHGMTTSDGTITFQGPAHSTLFFADRPQRVVGHLQTRKFVDEWGDGENSFRSGSSERCGVLPGGRRRCSRRSDRGTA